MKMKIRLKIKNRSHRYDINRPHSRMDINILNIKCINVMVATCAKQHLSNVWSSIHEKVKQNGRWFEKKCCL